MDSSEKSRWLTGIAEECFKIVPINNKIVGKVQLNRAKQGSKDSFLPPSKVKSNSENMEYAMRIVHFFVETGNTLEQVPSKHSEPISEF